jgi:YVTN family beta-propeller protein
MKRLGKLIAYAGFVLAAMTSISCAQAPRSTLLVLSKDDGTLAIVDPSTLKVLAKVPVGTNPHEVTASPDGRRAYVSNYANGSQNTITVVDLESRARLTTINLGPLYGPHGLTYVNGHPWFTAEREKLIGRLDPETNKVDWELGTGQTGTHLLWVSRDAHHIVTVNAGSSTLSLIQQHPVVSAEEAKKVPYSKYGGQTTRGTNGPPAADWDESVVFIGGHPEAFDVLHDASGNPTMVWAGKYDDGTIAVVDFATKKVVDTIQVNAPTVLRMRFTPDGRLAIVATDTGHDVVIVDVASRKVIKRIPIGTGGGGIAVSPDGGRAFVSISPGNYVAVIDLKKLALIGKINAGSDPDGMWWVGK